MGMALLRGCGSVVEEAEGVEGWRGSCDDSMVVAGAALTATVEGEAWMLWSLAEAAAAEEEEGEGWIADGMLLACAGARPSIISSSSDALARKKPNPLAIDAAAAAAAVAAAAEEDDRRDPGVR